MKGAWRQAYDVVALFILIEQDFGLAHLDKVFKRLVTIIMFIKAWVDIQQSFFYKAHIHHFYVGLDTDLADHLHNLLDRVEEFRRRRGCREGVGGCGGGGRLEGKDDPAFACDGEEAVAHRRGRRRAWDDSAEHTAKGPL
jgi:hypothetical protein